MILILRLKLSLMQYIQKLNYKFIRIRTVLMNIKRKNIEEKPNVEILGRRTDVNSRTLYRIRWLHDNNRESWEPIQHLKQYLKQINEFEQKYEQRTTSWSLSSALANSAEKQHNDKSHSQYRDRYSNEQAEFKQTQDSSSKYILTGKNQSVDEEIQTFDKPQTIQEECINQQIEAIQPAKQTLSIQPQNNKEIVLSQIKLLKRNRTISKNHRKPSSIKITRKAHLAKQIQIKQIQIVYPKNKIWYAAVLTSQNQTQQILRDELRVLNPALLLVYYEKQLQRKVKYAFQQ